MKRYVLPMSFFHKAMTLQEAKSITRHLGAAAKNDRVYASRIFGSKEQIFGEE
jgi:hypothetical protein